MATDALARLTLFSRRDCHLCDEMAAELAALKATHRFDLDVVDVDANLESARRYGDRVPVLTHGPRELCHARLDRAAVTAFLTEFR